MSQPAAPPCAFAAVYHRPRFYRYRVADAGLRVTLNRYTGQHGSVLIGAALVAGQYAYCVKWADARVST